jgi:hypothetical protein
MSRQFLAPLLAASVALCAPFTISSAAAQSDEKGGATATSAIATYLIEFAEPGLMRGTSRSSGQRLDINDPHVQAYRNQLMASQAAHKAAIAGALGRHPEVTHHYVASHSGIAARLTADEAVAVARLNGVVSVQIETMEEITTNLGPTFIGANTIWNGSSVPGGVGTRGEGMVIAVLDTGIVNTTHPSFANDASCGHGSPNPNKVLSLLDCASADGTGLCNGGAPNDTNNHGSHTASTAGGNAVPTSATPAPANPISGVAPCARLRIYKVCPTTSCPTANIQSGMDSILLHGDVDVMNFSISGGNSPWTDNDRKKLDLVDADVFVAASAGNTSVAIPNPIGNVAHRGPWVLSVAASTHHTSPDTLAGFSLRGPTPAPLQDLTKPDVTGPGVNVYAATQTAAGYGNISGTSMSSPHLAGAATLIRKVHPTWTPIEVKSAIMMSAKRAGTGAAGNWTWDEVGSGRIDLARAVNTGLVMDETTANFLAANPSGGSMEARDLNLPAVRDVTCEPSCSWTRTVRNPHATPSTWNVAVENPTGFALTASPTSFLIPAGGTQVITITAEPQLNEPGTAIRFGAVTLTKLPAGPDPVLHISVSVRGAGPTDPIFANGFELPPPIQCSSGPITIPDSGPASQYPVAFDFTGLADPVSSLRLAFTGFSHTFPNDVDMLLVGPGGHTLVVQSDVGGTTAVSNVNYTLSDAGTATVPSPLAAGNWRPTNSGAGDAFAAPAPAGPHNNPAPAGSATFGSVYNTLSASGVWNLFIVDDAGGDTGSINQVCLEINPAP